MYIFVNWSLHQATCRDQSGCAKGNQLKNFSLLVDMTIFFCLVRTRASEVLYVDLKQILQRGTAALRVVKKGISYSTNRQYTMYSINVALDVAFFHRVVCTVEGA
jgi:hypothetical protein